MIALVLAVAVATAAPVLRHLAWHATVGGEISTTSAAAAGISGDTRTRLAGGNVTQGGRRSARVDLTLDVIGRLADGGLAANVGESGDVVHPAVRIDIHPDGAVAVDTAHADDVSTEEMEIARLCAPKLLGERELHPGTTWQERAEAAGVKDAAVHRVTAVDGPRVTLVSEDTLTRGGIHALTRRTTRHIVYDTKLLVPVAVTIDRTSREREGGGDAVTNDAFALTLFEDSFAK